MKSLTMVGRFLLAAAITAFGIQHFIYARSGSGLGPPWTPEYHLLAYFAGIIFLIAAAALATGKQMRCAAIVLGVFFLARAAICYLPKIAATPHNPGPWTSGFELLAIGSAILMLASPRGIVFRSGRVLFAISLVVFATQHFLYGPFVATLIPAWIPGRLFWAYFVGGAFIAAALAIVSGKLAHLASTLLGTMFLLWVLILHAPRVAAALHNGNEWTSLFVALAMSGSGFVVASAFAHRK